MFMRGSHRYPYIVRLMGTGALFCLASVAGIRCWNGDAMVDRNLPFPIPCLNEWLIGDGWDPPGSTIFTNIFNFNFEFSSGDEMVCQLLLFRYYQLLFIIICLASVTIGITNLRYILYIQCKIYVIISDDGSVYLVEKRHGIQWPLLNEKVFSIFVCV